MTEDKDMQKFCIINMLGTTFLSLITNIADLNIIVKPNRTFLCLILIYTDHGQFLLDLII